MKENKMMMNKITAIQESTKDIPGIWHYESGTIVSEIKKGEGIPSFRVERDGKWCIVTPCNSVEYLLALQSIEQGYIDPYTHWKDEYGICVSELATDGE